MKRGCFGLVLGLMVVGQGVGLGQKPVARMPNAVAICSEGCTITAIPAGTSYQLGTGEGNGYTPAEKATGKGGSLQVYFTSFPFDPAPNRVKTFYVQQKDTAYTVTYTRPGSRVPVTVTIPAVGDGTAATPAAGGAASDAGGAKASAVKAPPVKQGPPPAPPPTPTTVQVIQYTCAAPVVGTVIPPGLPNGVAVVCVYGLANLPLTQPAPTTPAN